MTAVYDETPALDADNNVPVDTETSDEFIPDITHVYELVDAAEDRLSIQITERFDQLEKQLFAVMPDGDGNPVAVGALAIIMGQTQWLGENLLPAIAQVHDKFDAVIADVRAFVDMVAKSRNPLIAKMLRGKGGVNDATQAEEEG